MVFKDSAIAHRYLDGLYGVEIGGSAHNPFNLNTINVDFTDDMDTIFKEAEMSICGKKLPVDVVAPGDDLPFKCNSYDFVISSHVIEHIFDPIQALLEWKRVIKPGGYILTIAPLKQFTPGEWRPITTYDELMLRHMGKVEPPLIDNGFDVEGNPLMTKEQIINILNTHHTVFDVDLYLEICKYCNLNVVEVQQRDDKVGNGMLILCRK